MISPQHRSERRDLKKSFVFSVCPVKPVLGPVSPGRIVVNLMRCILTSKTQPKGGIMAFYIVQHGLSLPKDQDPQKGLAPEGMQDVRRIAAVARDYGVNVERIVHSGKKRALQTAEILADVLKPGAGIEEISGINPLDDVVAFAPQADFQANTMVVGHLPFLERLTSFLIYGRQEPIVFKLQNGGILCLDQIENQDKPAIKWALMPTVG
jgi:phosphohistidine phosphatase